MNKNKKLICIIIWMVCLITLTVIAITGTPGQELVDRMMLVIFAGMGFDVIMFLYYNHQGKLRINTKVNKTEKTIYHREPPFDYSPVIVTYLQNLKLEFKKDIVAEIAFLINKKILKLEKINNEYYISFHLEDEEKSVSIKDKIDYDNGLKEFIDQYNAEIEKIDNKYYMNFNFRGKRKTLSLSEYYFYGDTLEKVLKNNEIKTEKIELKAQYAILKNIPNEGKIKLEELVKKLENRKNYIELCYERDCINLGYIEKGKRIERFNTKMLYIIIVILLIPTITILLKMTDMFGVGAMICAAILVGIISLAYSIPFISMTNTVKIRTQKAKEEYAEWLAFIDFIKDYSLLNQRELQELEIWDNYLTYSIAFGVTKVNDLLKI